MKIGIYAMMILATLGFACIWFLLGYGVLMLCAWIMDWWAAIGTDPMEEFFNEGLPAKKHQK